MAGDGRQGEIHDEDNRKGRRFALHVNRQRRPKSRPPIWSPEGAEPLPGTTFLAHVESLLGPDGRGPLPGGGRPYPDRPPASPDDPRWIKETFEGSISSHRLRSEGDGAALAAAAVIEACRRPLSTLTVHLVAERLSAIEWPDQVDDLLQAIRDSQPIDRQRLAALARWICTFGVTRGQLKAAIAILGISGGPRDADLVKKLGLVDSLTLFSVVALQNLLLEPVNDLFDLAKQVSGWGRVHAIRRLRGTTDPGIRDWLLRGGYDSGVIVEEVAFLAVMTGGLLSALQGDVDDELLDHAGVLLAALAIGGPAEDMSDYNNCAVALQLYFDELECATASLRRRDSLATLARYLADEERPNPVIDRKTRATLSARAQSLLERPEWVAVVEASLASAELTEVRQAIWLAPGAGIDPRPVALDWLARAGHDPFIWSTALKGVDRDEFLRLVDLADRLLPFAELPQGASRSLGIGREFAANGCFERLLGSLGRFPGDEWRLVEIGLSSSVTRTRLLALRVLDEWSPEHWPDGARATLLEHAAHEPEERARTRMLELAAPAYIPRTIG